MPAGVHLQRQLNTRVSDDAHAIVRYYAAKWSVSQSEALERLLREKARSDGYRITDIAREYAPR